jgi:hypothetical protein
MDRIDFSVASILAQSESLKQGAKQTKAGAELKGKSKTHFSDIMKKSLLETGELGPLLDLAPSEEAMTELMDAVHSAGSDLIERPFHDEILKYKRAVRNFVHYVVKNGFDVQEVKGIKKKTVIQGETEWKPMHYHQLRVIDQKLEELAAAILSGQTNQLTRVSKIDEIKGLLVDLTISGAIRAREKDGGRG